MTALRIPHSYSDIPWQHVKVTTHPPNQSGATAVMVLAMNHPEKYNTFTEGLENDMICAINLFDVDDRVKAVVVTGEGRMFCAGADLDVGLHRAEGERGKDHRDGGGRLTLAIHRCRKPVIAAIQGSAVGVGMTMTLPMAIRIVTATAKVGFVFAQRGVVMEACSSFFLPRLIGYSKALYLTTTGAVMAADSPAVRDLFAEVLPTPAEVLPRALEIATEVATKTSSVSTYLMKEMMWRNPGTAEATHLLDSEIMFQLYDKKDKIEGIDSFLEKRTAKFEGSVLKDLPDCVPWWPRIDVEKEKKPTLEKL